MYHELELIENVGWKLQGEFTRECCKCKKNDEKISGGEQKPPLTFTRAPEISEEVGKALKKFPQAYARRIDKTIGALPSDPYRGDLKKVKGEPLLWRRRVGDYRIFFEINQRTRSIEVRWVEHRGSKTYS